MTNNPGAGIQTLIDKAPTVHSEMPIRSFLEKLQKVPKVKAKVILALHEYDIKQEANFKRMLTNGAGLAQHLIDLGAKELVFLPGMENPSEAESIIEKRFRYISA